MTSIKTLSELKGVGPATATMVLQAKSDVVPFMSDEAMLQVFNGDKTKLKYDLKTCTTFIEKIYNIAESLGHGKDFSESH
jgi:3-methyladenine DNA glycosylase/8-oxoguanine DNA glycosylase